MRYIKILLLTLIIIKNSFAASRPDWEKIIPSICAQIALEGFNIDGYCEEELVFASQDQHSWTLSAWLAGGDCTIEVQVDKDNLGFYITGSQCTE